MLLFIGVSSAGESVLTDDQTDMIDGPQFHVIIHKEADLTELKAIVWKKLGIPTSSQIYQHNDLPLHPHQSLVSQGIEPYSCLHLYIVEDLRRREVERRKREEEDAERRGWYMTVEGKIRLRRKSRRKCIESGGIAGVGRRRAGMVVDGRVGSVNSPDSQSCSTS